MSLTEAIVDGTLNPDGTLALDHDPPLPPGRVRVIIQAAASAPGRRLADVIGEINAGQQARGFTGRSAADIQTDEASRAAEDDDYDQRMQTLRSQTASVDLPAKP